MNDERLGKEIGAFYRETDVTPPDPQESARQVAARLRRTPQVTRRRWLPAWRLQTTQPPDTDQTTEQQPSPIPDTTHRFPTVIGRTQTMFSPVKAITAGALVFAIGGVLLIAQPFEQQGSLPGAEQAAKPAPPVGVTITESEGGVLDEVCTDATPPVCTWNSSSQWSATDDRLSGTATWQVIERTWGGTGWIFEARAFEVVNDEGAWVGTGRYVGRDLDTFFATLTGEEAYEGLSAVVTNADADEEGMKGVIIEGELPPFPELPAE